MKKENNKKKHWLKPKIKEVKIKEQVGMSVGCAKVDFADEPGCAVGFAYT